MSELDRETWNVRHGEMVASGEPSPFLSALDPVLPRSGRALDVAGGRGRHALWLARRGLDVTLVDVSDVALFAAEGEARAAGLRLETLRIDLDVPGRLPAGPWDVLVSFYFLNRALFARYAEVLSPGGWIVVAHPTVENLARHPRPGPDHLLAQGELPRLLSGVEVVSYQEAWSEGGRHEARLVGRKHA